VTASELKVLVVGASGLLGGTITRDLLFAGKSVRILSRTPANAKLDEQLLAGSERVVGDLKNLSSLQVACANVDVVVSTATSVLSSQPGDNIESVDRDGQLSLVQAAETAGVKRFVYISFPPQAEDFPLQAAKRAVETRLTASAMSYAILRPTCFQDVWLSPTLGFDYVNSRVKLFGSGTNPMRWISVQDVANAAVHAVSALSPMRETIELLGPESVSGLQAVKIFEEQSGRSFEVEHVPEEFLASQQASAVDSRQQSFFALARQVARGYAPFSPGVPPVEPKVTVRNYAERVLANAIGK
jgi:uncharacterized protein YbjT (DUF2867 family)